MLLPMSKLHASPAVSASCPDARESRALSSGCRHRQARAKAAMYTLCLPLGARRSAPGVRQMRLGDCTPKFYMLSHARAWNSRVRGLPFSCSCVRAGVVGKARAVWELCGVSMPGAASTGWSDSRRKNGLPPAHRRSSGMKCFGFRTAREIKDESPTLRPPSAGHPHNLNPNPGHPANAHRQRHL